jgi:thioredoxin reductase (NADPH)
MPSTGTPPACLVTMDRFHTRVPFSDLRTLQRATALGRIDFSIMKGWVTPEEWLYPQVQQALSAWTVAHRPRHVVYRIVGHQWDRRSHELRDMLGRNGVPFAFYTADSPAGQQLIQDFGIDVKRLPAAIRHDGSVLQDPTFAEIAASHGIQTRPSSEVYDLAIVGAGPAGLAAAVYGASEGLRTVVLESWAIGGQAGASSMIRNYLGFPRGISGGALAHRAWEQAVLFGAEFVFTHQAVTLRQRDSHRVIALEGGSQAVTRAAIIATGVAYRRLGDSALDRLIGAGVFYGAAGIEAPAMAGEEGLRRRWGELRWSGCGPLGQVCCPRHAAPARRIAGCGDVGLPHQAAQGHAERRCSASHPSCRRPRRGPSGGAYGRRALDGAARTAPRRGRLRTDRRSAAHRVAWRRSHARR